MKLTPEQIKEIVAMCNNLAHRKIVLVDTYAIGLEEAEDLLRHVTALIAHIRELEKERDYVTCNGCGCEENILITKIYCTSCYGDYET